MRWGEPVSEGGDQPRPEMRGVTRVTSFKTLLPLVSATWRGAAPVVSLSTDPCPVPKKRGTVTLDLGRPVGHGNCSRFSDRRPASTPTRTEKEHDLLWNIVSTVCCMQNMVYVVIMDGCCERVLNQRLFYGGKKVFTAAILQAGTSPDRSQRRIASGWNRVRSNTNFNCRGEPANGHSSEYVGSQWCAAIQRVWLDQHDNRNPAGGGPFHRRVCRQHERESRADD
jgi:hypothetical protein